ncbi:MAG: glycosyltransferase [Reinekea sp.]
MDVVYMAKTDLNGRLRVLHIISDDLRVGAEAQAYTLLKPLKNDCDVFVVLMNKDELEEKRLNCSIPVVIFDQSLHSCWQLLLLLRQGIKRVRPNAIHTHQKEENILGALANVASLNSRCVRTVQGSPEFPDSNMDPKPMKNNILFMIHCEQHTSVCYPSSDKSYIHKKLDIPGNRKVVFYSGYMEERKGIRTIVSAAKELADRNLIEEIHVVLCGNIRNQADTYLSEIEKSPAKTQVTFADYRGGITELMRSSDIDVIAFTVWDSLTRSSIEMHASGIPLIASNLRGLAETTIHDETGYLFEPGGYCTLANYIYELTVDPLKVNPESVKLG